MEKPVKTIKAWLAMVEGENYIAPVGNGFQFQYPIFPTRKEAKQFTEEVHGVNKVVRCTITLPSK